MLENIFSKSTASLLDYSHASDIDQRAGEVGK